MEEKLRARILVSASCLLTLLAAVSFVYAFEGIEHQTYSLYKTVIYLFGAFWFPFLLIISSNQSKEVDS